MTLRARLALVVSLIGVIPMLVHGRQGAPFQLPPPTGGQAIGVTSWTLTDPDE